MSSGHVVTGVEVDCCGGIVEALVLGMAVRSWCFVEYVLTTSGCEVSGCELGDYNVIYRNVWWLEIW